MKYIQRDASVLTGKKNLEHLITFKNFPVFIGATDQHSNQDIFADISIAICKDTGIIQLEKVLPLDVIYSGYHSEALGGIWKEHHESFNNFIQKYNVQNVLEIGGSDGRLAKKYIQKNPHASWTIVEPNPVPFSHKQILFINKPFDSSFHFSGKIDSIIHSHTLEHMYYPKECIEKIAALLKTDDLHIFSVPNLATYLHEKFTNILNFEHTIFLTEYFIDYLLAQNHFEVVEKSYFHNHSIFYATKKIKNKHPFRFESKYEAYKKEYCAYVAENKKIIKTLNSFVDTWSGDIYLFGGHIFSQFLIHQGLHKVKLKGILDNSTLKQGKRLYGTPFVIYPPTHIFGKQKVAVILKAGAYQEEVKKQLLEINSSITIWE